MVESGQGVDAALAIFQILDQVANEHGYENGAQDLIGEEPCVNVELLQEVQEILINNLNERRRQAIEALRLAEEEVQRAYV